VASKPSWWDCHYQDTESFARKRWDRSAQRNLRRTQPVLAVLEDLRVPLVPPDLPVPKVRLRPSRQSSPSSLEVPWHPSHRSLLLDLVARWAQSDSTESCENRMHRSLSNLQSSVLRLNCLRMHS